MGDLETDLGAVSERARETLRDHWKLYMFQGAVLIILGVLALAAPVIASIAVDIYVGWLFLLGGLIGLIASFSTRGVSSFLWSFVTALLVLAVGVVLLVRPIEGALTLTFVLTTFFIIEGLFQIVVAISYRNMQNFWGWMLLSGAADLLMAGIVIANWPMSGVWVLGVLAGISLLMSGIATVIAAMTGRRMAHQRQIPSAGASMPPGRTI